MEEEKYIEESCSIFLDEKKQIILESIQSMKFTPESDQRKKSFEHVAREEEKELKILLEMGIIQMGQSNYHLTRYGHFLMHKNTNCIFRSKGTRDVHERDPYESNSYEIYAERLVRHIGRLQEQNADHMFNILEVAAPLGFNAYFLGMAIHLLRKNKWIVEESLGLLAKLSPLGFELYQKLKKSDSKEVPEQSLNDFNIGKYDLEIGKMNFDQVRRMGKCLYLSANAFKLFSAIIKNNYGEPLKYGRILNTIEFRDEIEGSDDLYQLCKDFLGSREDFDFAFQELAKKGLFYSDYFGDITRYGHYLFRFENPLPLGKKLRNQLENYLLFQIFFIARMKVGQIFSSDAISYFIDFDITFLKECLHGLAEEGLIEIGKTELSYMLNESALKRISELIEYEQNSFFELHSGNWMSIEPFAKHFGDLFDFKNEYFEPRQFLGFDITFQVEGIDNLPELEDDEDDYEEDE